jgi:hypothetical protein
MNKTSMHKVTKPEWIGYNPFKPETIEEKNERIKKYSIPNYHEDKTEELDKHTVKEILSNEQQAPSASYVVHGDGYVASDSASVSPNASSGSHFSPIFKDRDFLDESGINSLPDDSFVFDHTGSMYGSDTVAYAVHAAYNDSSSEDIEFLAAALDNIKTGGTQTAQEDKSCCTTF